MGHYQTCQTWRTNLGRSHAFDPVSGWCRFGCGQREDGRISSRMGGIYDPGPSYTDTELAEIATRLERRS